MLLVLDVTFRNFSDTDTVDYYKITLISIQNLEHSQLLIDFIILHIYL
jgi:hypothetical protein